MHPVLKRLTVACAGALLFACADTGLRQGAATAPAADANEAYLIGRSAHLAMRFDQAAVSYQAALRAAPGHVNAGNGLAALYAERGYLAKAIGLWEALTAQGAQTREHAYLYSNLGHAYFLNGDFEKSREALEKAAYLDPLNHRAWHKLGETMDKLGQPDRAQSMFKQAATLQGHDFKSDYALAPRAGLATIDGAVGESRQWARTEVSQSPGGLFVMRRVEAGAPAAAPATALAAAPARMASLEIRNGNGVRGMARKMARSMHDGEARVVRLSNEKGFKVRQTRVEYQPAFRDAAERLALRVGATRVVAAGAVGRADMRLVIGRDLVRERPLHLAHIKGP
ncbi:MAG: tetratricopeptide repeat protein [Pseudomonadota bacterium]